jgi:hypothetical protein
MYLLFIFSSEVSDTVFTTCSGSQSFFADGTLKLCDIIAGTNYSLRQW